jgi:putative ABC transport system permease protein
MTPDPYPRLPAIPRALLRFASHDEGEEVMADVGREYAFRAERDGIGKARFWVWRQALGSLPSAFQRGWFRGTTGFESEATRMSGRSMNLESLILDARFALRGLRRRPQHLVLSVLTLALGIGGTTAIFGIARAVLLTPLPYRQSSELVEFWNTFDWSEAEIAFMRPDWPGFAKVAGYRTEDVFLRIDGSPARLVPGIATSAELFDVLGTRPMLGPGFEPGADAQGADLTAVLSYGLWQELGGSRDIIGRTMPLDGAPRRIVGVMPKGFWFPDPSIRVWLSQGLRPENRTGNYALVGRLASGRTIDGMTDQLRLLTTRLGGQFSYPPQWDKTKNAELTPLRDYLLGPVRPALLATFAGMAVILLMACANVATLMLAQLRGRASELALRVAIGAGRRRLTQQLAIESMVLALLAGIAGAAAAWSGFQALLAALPLGEMAAAAVADWRLFGTAMVVALVTALLISLAPIFSLWRGDTREALQRARSGGIGARGGRLEDALVVVEVALAVLLASGAGVLIRSVANLRQVNDGIDEHNVALIAVSASSEITWQQRWPNIQRMMEGLRALPGVKSVAVTQRPPFSRGDNWGITVEGKPDLPQSTTVYRIVSRDYFATLGIRLRRGRLFDATDVPNSEPVVVIDEALAQKYFPNENPIGRMIQHGLFEGNARIIGVVSNVAHQGLTDKPEPGRYMLMDQVQYTHPASAILVRYDGSRPASAILEEARSVIQSTANTFAVQESTTMENRVALAMGPTRRIMQLMTMLGALALTLGAVGVYGVVSHFVNRRKRDWVIRMALGMKPISAVQQVVTRGAALASAGAVLGLVAAFMLMRLLSSLLYEVSPADPTVLICAAATLIVTGSIAALLPGLRASRANAAHVLRESA